MTVSGDKSDRKQTRPNCCLLAGALGTMLAALAHVGCILFGADWYRFFGAGEQMAQMAAQGLWYPTAVTALIVVMLLVWMLYALAGAGVIRTLPLQRPLLVLISGVLLARGGGFFAMIALFPGNSLTFWLVSSAFCLLLGALFAIGTSQQWAWLGGRRRCPVCWQSADLS